MTRRVFSGRGCDVIVTIMYQKCVSDIVVLLAACKLSHDL